MKKGNRLKGFGRISMKLQVMFVCIVSSLLVIGAISFTTLPKITKELKESTEAHMSDFIQSHSDKIMTSVDNIEREMNTLENSSAILYDVRVQAQSGQQDAVAKYDSQLEAINNEMSHFATDSSTNILLVSMSGNIIASNNSAYINTSIPESRLKGFSNDKDKITSEASYDKNTKKLTLTFVKPVYSSTKQTGYIVYYKNGDELAKLIDDYTLTKIPAPRLYLLDKNGLVIAHTNPDSVGTTTSNPLLLPKIEEIKNGTYKETGAQSGYYIYEGQNVTVSYIHIPETDWVLGVNALDTELYKDVNKTTRQYAISAIVILVVISILLYFVAAVFTKPIEQMSSIVSRIGDLDFTIDINDKKFRKVVKKKDEIGDMAKSVEHMITVVKDRVLEIKDSSGMVTEAAAQLKAITTDITEKANDTSATTEELSAGMEETTATTDIITSNVKTVQDNVASIKGQIEQSTEFTQEIRKRAEAMKEDSAKSEAHTRNTFDEIKKRGSIAMEQSKATEKINEFTSVIMDIADQTSLLALNASIEAARAGEAGRGFGVVADEIGNLAQQSSDTVAKITEIVASVNEAVRNITQCLSDSQNFVENNVYKDYEGIFKIIDSYSNDAGSIYQTMNDIDQNTQELYQAMQSMTESIMGINQTVQESAIGVSDIAQRNNDIGALTAKSNDMVNETNDIADQLKTSISVFRL